MSFVLQLIPLMKEHETEVWNLSILVCTYLTIIQLSLTTVGMNNVHQLTACTKEGNRVMVLFLWSEGVKRCGNSSTTTERL